MTHRDQLLSVAVTPEHTRSIQLVQERFESFCCMLRVPACEEAVALYLTWLLEEPNTTARTLQRTLAALDAARRLRGEPAWSESADLRVFVLGLHRERPIGSRSQRGEPLYLEHVAHLVEATMAPTPSQQRELTAIALHVATGLTAVPLTRLRWRDVCFRRDVMDIAVPPPPGRQHWPPRMVRLHAEGRPLCPVRAMRQLRALSDTSGTYVFAEGCDIWGRDRMAKTLAELNACSGDAVLAAERACRSPQQARDRALLVLGYGAALRSKEAIALRQRDVTIHQHGLLLSIDGRRAVTAVPSDPGQPTDPVQAWTDWVQAMADENACWPERRAFPAISGTRIWAGPLGGRRRLNEIVQRACDRAQLPGHFVFTSLRSGLVRTAIRANEQAHDIAAHTDLRTLGAVALHRDREHLLTRSAAGQLGL